jgi:hypothetical protein
MRLDIGSEERMDLLNRSIESSERCKEYAGRGESISLGPDVDSDKFMQSGAFNPCELKSTRTLNFSLLSRSCLNHVTSLALTLILLTDRFRNLRHIDLYAAQLDEALLLPSLETYSVFRTFRINMDTSAEFKSANLPNLRRLTIGRDFGERTVGQLYDSVLPQLDHLYIHSLSVGDFERVLPLSAPVQSLGLSLRYHGEGLSKVLNQIRRVAVKELHLVPRIKRDNSDNWETDFELIEELKKLVERKEGLKQLKLELHVRYRARPSEDVSARLLASWRGIKGELELTCVRKGIEVQRLTCSLSLSLKRKSGPHELWEVASSLRFGLSAGRRFQSVFCYLSSPCSS